MSERLDPSESAILLADLHDGEVAEAPIPRGFPGKLVADGQEIPIPERLRFGASIQDAYEHGPVWSIIPLTVKWRKRLEWHITNPGTEAALFGLRYRVFAESEIEALNQWGQAVVREAGEPQRLREGIRQIRAMADITANPAESILNRLTGIIAECDALLKEED